MAFWKKIFKSKYTGAEIDAAVAKAGNLPAVSSADAGKALIVDEEGKIVTGEAGGGDIGIINIITDIPNSAIRSELTLNEVIALMTTGPCLVHWIFGEDACTYLPFYASVSGMQIFGYDLQDSSNPPKVYQFTPLTIDGITYYGLNT